MASNDEAPKPADPASTPAVPLPPPPPPVPVADAPTRRRRQRSWSSPSATVATESFERPITERDWSRDRATTPPSTPLLATSPRPPAVPAPVGEAATLAELRADIAGLRAELAAERAEQSTTRLTGAELAASIEALGTTLGTGLASLLTEHRSLLARDLEGAADRILEEVGQRMRTAGTQTVDGVEERVRHVSAKGLGDLSAALELRLDQLEADVSGLRAVMLEIPDQTQVVERLDQLADSVGSARARDTQRVSPALTAALDRAMEGPLAQLEALTKEMASLRRRIALRPDLMTDVIGPADAIPVEEEPPPPPTPAEPAHRPRRAAPAKAEAPAAAPAKRPARRAAKRPAS
jgi:hypothetical protein